MGDVTQRIALTPVAIREGAAVATTLYGGVATPADHVNVPHAVFSLPPVGVVGLSEAQARELFANVKIYKTTFRPLKYTLSGRNERTLMKLVVDADSQRVLGAHMVGPDAPEIIQAIAIAVKAGSHQAGLRRDGRRTPDRSRGVRDPALTRGTAAAARRAAGGCSPTRGRGVSQPLTTMDGRCRAEEVPRTSCRRTPDGRWYRGIVEAALR